MSLLNQRYLKVIKIGQGSYGDVYAAQDKLYKKSPNDTMDIEQDPSNKLNLVALKKLKSCNKEGVHFSTIREIKILKEANHPNIIKLLDTFVEKESIYLVLEYCLTDLNKILHAKINLTLNDIKTIMFQIIQGVNHLHKMFILHRDLSTSNLLFNQDGFLKISDFGLARYHGSPNKLLTRNIVTRYYRPPEILYGSQGCNNIFKPQCHFLQKHPLHKQIYI